MMLARCNGQREVGEGYTLLASGRGKSFWASIISGIQTNKYSIRTSHSQRWLFTTHASLQRQPSLLRSFGSTAPGFHLVLRRENAPSNLLHSHLLMDKIYRSFARFAATVACKFSPCHRTDQPMTIPGCTGLLGFAMWIVAITIVLITHDKLPLNPEAYAYLPAPCHTELECDIVAYPTAMLNVWVVLLGLFYVIAILISSLARRTRFLSFITVGMCTVLVVLLYIFFFRYVCLHMIGVGHAQLIMFFSGPEAVGGTQPAGTSLA